MIKKMCYVAIAAVILVSCVPQRKLEECQAKQKACEDELAATKASYQTDEAKLKDLTEQLAQNNKDLDGMRKDTTVMSGNYKMLTSKYEKLNQLNDELMDKYGKQISNSEKDNAKLSGDLQETQKQLLKKQDDLNTLSMQLNTLSGQLNKQKQSLDSLSAQVQAREKRVNELEAILKQKDDAAAALKKKLSDALYNFEGKGLTITQKNGKIYVSMDESLLFASGKTAVEPKGIEALKNLAKVLDQNPDINIMVEGHTDNVPMHGNGEIKDNWDLSVMRATSVTKIILQSSPNIDPTRISAAGRGEFFPLDPAKTPEARKKNRRTEIILTPKLDELLKVLGSN
jgi:chemotaxis protein MotB